VKQTNDFCCNLKNRNTKTSVYFEQVRAHAFHPGLIKCYTNDKKFYILESLAYLFLLLYHIFSLCRLTTLPIRNSLSLSLPALNLPLTNLSHHRLPSSPRTESTDFKTGPFLLSISDFCFIFFIALFAFGSVRQIKLAIRQLLGARKHSVSYRIYHLTSPDSPVNYPAESLALCPANMREFLHFQYHAWYLFKLSHCSLSSTV